MRRLSIRLFERTDVECKHLGSTWNLSMRISPLCGLLVYFSPFSRWWYLRLHRVRKQAFLSSFSRFSFASVFSIFVLCIDFSYLGCLSFLLMNILTPVSCSVRHCLFLYFPLSALINYWYTSADLESINVLLRGVLYTVMQHFFQHTLPLLPSSYSLFEIGPSVQWSHLLFHSISLRTSRNSRNMEFIRKRKEESSTFEKK